MAPVLRLLRGRYPWRFRIRPGAPRRPERIALRSYLSLHTVKAHARSIYAKLGASSRTQAVASGRALGCASEDRRPDG